LAYTPAYCGSVIRHSVNQGDTLAHANYIWNIKIQSFTFSVLGYKLFETWMPKVTREELSNQRKSEKIVDSAETKETELDVLHSQKDFLASISTPSQMNVCAVAGTTTFRSYTPLPTT